YQWLEILPHNPGEPEKFSRQPCAELTVRLEHERGGFKSDGREKHGCLKRQWIRGSEHSLGNKVRHYQLPCVCVRRSPTPWLRPATSAPPLGRNGITGPLDATALLFPSTSSTTC